MGDLAAGQNEFGLASPKNWITRKRVFVRTTEIATAGLRALFPFFFSKNKNENENILLYY